MVTLTSSNDTQPRLLRHTAKDMVHREIQVDTNTTLAELNERYMNIRPTGIPLQCEEDWCKYLAQTLNFAAKISLEEMSSYRYVMDVDGNA